jgi:hypothetical protein
MDEFNQLLLQRWLKECEALIEADKAKQAAAAAPPPMPPPGAAAPPPDLPGIGIPGAAPPLAA